MSRDFNGWRCPVCLGTIAAEGADCPTCINAKSKTGTVPDFGLIRVDIEGIPMTCRAIAPGLSLHDLVMIFLAAQAAAQPADAFAGNPGRWPITRGVNAVADAVLAALYRDRMGP